MLLRCSCDYPPAPPTAASCLPPAQPGRPSGRQGGPRLWRAGGRGEQPGHWLRGWAGPCNLQGGQPGLGDRLKGWTGLLATDTHPCCLLLAQTLQEGGNGGFPSWQHGAVEGGQGQGAAVPGTGEEGGGPGQGGQAVREEAQSQ